jgi:2-dehydro-3-deoxyphosphogluconate aldolase/(4S)-4-hydroxy-2-oxoglutarate aldolase
VSIENARDWIRAGAMAVGVGSALLDPRALAAGDFEQISRNARRIATEVRSARGES